MSMFEDLFALACTASLTMTITAEPKAGRMTINVIPRPHKDADEAALTQPLSLTATPQEFDAGFIAALQGYREVRQSLADQVEATKEVIEAAKAAAVKKASDASTKARADKPATPSPSPAKQLTSTVATRPSDPDDENTGDAEQASPVQPAGEVMDLFG